jgi:hypothetical protein
MTSLCISDVIANNVEKNRVSFIITTIATHDRDDGDLPGGAVHINEDGSLSITSDYKSVVVESVLIDHVAFAVTTSFFHRLHWRKWQIECLRDDDDTCLHLRRITADLLNATLGREVLPSQLFAQFHNATHHSGLRLSEANPALCNPYVLRFDQNDVAFQYIHTDIYRIERTA